MNVQLTVYNHSANDSIKIVCRAVMLYDITKNVVGVLNETDFIGLRFQIGIWHIRNR